MSHEETQEAELTLGNFLREQREQKGLTLDEIGDATKISKPVLKAIEEDNYQSMPADAFCRGFYTLYANFLDLDTASIIQQYEENRGIIPVTSYNPGKPPGRDTLRFSNYAEPSSVSPITSMSIVALVCIILFSGACWYFKFSPMDYINTKLLPPQTAIEIQQTELMGETDTETIYVNDEQTLDTSVLNTQKSSLPEVSTPALTQELNTTAVEEVVEKEEPEVTLYHLEIVFDNSGTMKVTLDDNFVLEKQFQAGKTLRWEVKEKIILDMPEHISGTLHLNGIEITLPRAENGRRLLSLPEDLLN